MNASNRVYLLCPYGLGDTMLVCGYLPEWERRYGLKGIPIIKRSHVSLMRMYGITEYIIYDFSAEEIAAIEQKKKRNAIVAGEIYITRSGYEENNSDFRKFIDRRITFKDVYLRALGLDSSCKLRNPICYPQVKSSLRAKMPKGIDIEDITIILPEMNAPEIDTVPIEYFENLVDYQDESIIVNMIHPKGELGKKNVDLTLEELIALAVNCKRVISSRSGICDVIYKEVKSMTVIYPNSVFYDLYRFDSIFCENNPNVNEQILELNRGLRKLGIKSCAVYGIAFVGQRIVECLRREGMPVKYVIDRNPDAETIGCERYSPNDNLPKVDAIIITPERDKDMIIKQLKNKVDAELIFYKDLIRC